MEAAAVLPADDRPELLLERVQELQDRLDAAGDDAIREVADELVSAVVQMYGAGLERIVDGLVSCGEQGESLARRLTEDQFLATLLLIHDLHPVPLADRVQGALEEVRPYMESHGGNVELLSLEDGVARIHLRGSCSDCAASSVTLELAIKQALEQAAPDLEGLEVEGIAAQTGGGSGLPMVTGSGGPAPPAPSGVDLPMVMAAPAAPAAPAWLDVESMAELRDGQLAAVELAGQALVIANVEGTLLAYRDVCAGCGKPLRDGELDTGKLACRHCERAFFLPRAGRSLDDDGLQLEPVPLLRDEGKVRVALAQ